MTGLATNTPASGDTYGRSETITATVTFSHTMAADTNEPVLRVQIGSVNRDMTCTNCGDSRNWRGFSYTVQAADSDTDGISIRDGALVGGTLERTFYGTVLNRTISSTLEIVNSANHKVDGGQWGSGVAGVDAVALSAPAVGDTFERGEVIEATVTFNRAVDVTGTPQLALTVGANTRQANYATGHGSTALTFRYTVVQADADPDGISIGATALALNSGTIVVSGGTTNALLGLGSHAVSNSADHKVDGSALTAPAVSGAAIASRPAGRGSYGAGEEIEVRVTFNREVDVTGTPQLALTVGEQTRQADYATGTGGATLSFSYTVAADDVDEDGISVDADALTLNAGGINDARSATTAAGLALGTHAIGDAAGHRVNFIVDDGNGEDGRPGGPPPSRVSGVRVSPLDGGLRVTWSAAAGSVSQYRVDVADAAGELARRVYAEADVFEAVVDGLANGVEYTVTVSAVPGHGGENGPPSEPRTATPQAGAGDPDPGGSGEPDPGGEPDEPDDMPGDTEDVPVPALPLAGAGVLAGLLASAAYRFRRAGRRAHPGR